MIGGESVAEKAEDRWAKAEASLTGDRGNLLKQLRADYLAAARLHVPKWSGGPSAEILAELIRQGWHK